MDTLVTETLGNEIPTRNPKTTPKMVVTMSLVLSFDLFRSPL